MEQSKNKAKSNSPAPDKASSRRAKPKNAPSEGSNPAKNTTSESPLWAVDDYGPDMTGAAAEKLFDSAVAPIVAASRGYWRAETDEDYHEWATYVGLKKTHKMYRSVRDGVVGTDDNGHPLDGLVMPWYSVKYTDLLRNGKSTEGFEPEWQLRPAEPVDLGQGKKMKYIFAKNASMPLDIHPSTPTQWLTKAPVILFAEGLLKGDSAMTAHLIAHGADMDLLTDTSEDALDRLADFMEDLPVDSQVLILRSASATTFHSDPVSLGQLNLAGRVAWMGFDADIETNPMVWDQARKFHNHLINNQKVREVKLLSPTADDGGKDGIDDFLSHRGTWDALIDPDGGHLRKKLPERPRISDHNQKPGSWRITEDFADTEELKVLTDEMGLQAGFEWVPADVSLGGQVVYIEDRREPTGQELMTGQALDPIEAGSADAYVGIEVSYRVDDHEPITHLVEGPITILRKLPAEWDQFDAHIPHGLSMHPHWPPRGQKGEKWLEAVKRASSNTETYIEWTKMGWVPVEGDLPAFIVGDTVTAWSHESASSVRPGITTDDLHNLSSFGIGGRPDHQVIHPADDLEGWRAQAVEDFNEVRKLYLDNEPWTDLGVAGIVLLSALRPVVPVFEPVANPRSTLFIHGPAGGGKSMTAKHIMAFWAANGSDFTSALPGSAEDTRAAMEHAVSITPIWTIDDLAPSPSRRAAEAQETAITDIIRSTFNASPKMRMTREMGVRKASKPAAQLIITAENELSVPSAAQRSITLRIGRGSLSPSPSVTNAIFNAAATGLQARVTQHAVLGLYDSLGPLGWQRITKLFTEYYTEEQELIQKMLVTRSLPKSKVQRLSEVISDITIVIPYLKTLEQGLGFGVEWGQYLFEDRAGRWGNEKLLREAIVDYMVSNYQEQQDTTPGKSIITAIRLALDMNQAHIESAEDPSRPPYVTDTDTAVSGLTDGHINSQLGWLIDAEGNARPQGPTIGRLVRSSKYGDVVLLDALAAFTVASRHHDSIILPGMKQGAAMSSIWEEGLAPEALHGLRGDAGNSRNSVRIRTDANARFSGVPIDVRTLLELE